MVLLAGEEYGVPSDPRPTKSAPYWLQNIAHEKNGQTLVAVVRTEDLPKWFHEQVKIRILLSLTLLFTGNRKTITSQRIMTNRKLSS
jgi:hypothetical protein